MVKGTANTPSSFFHKGLNTKYYEAQIALFLSFGNLAIVASFIFSRCLRCLLQWKHSLSHCQHASPGPVNRLSRCQTCDCRFVVEFLLFLLPWLDFALGYMAQILNAACDNTTDKNQSCSYGKVGKNMTYKI